MHAGQAGNGDQLKYDESQGEAKTNDCRGLQERCTILISFDGDQCGSAGEEIADRCTNGTHIHEPAKGFTTQNRTRQGNDDAEYHGIFRRAIFFVHNAEPFRQITLAAHGEHQPGRG